MDRVDDAGAGCDAGEGGPGHVVVIRAWFEEGSFRARMILDADDDAAEVVVTDSVDWLCDSLRAYFAERTP